MAKGSWRRIGRRQPVDRGFHAPKRRVPLREKLYVENTGNASAEARWRSSLTALLTKRPRKQDVLIDHDIEAVAWPDCQGRLHVHVPGDRLLRHATERIGE